MGHKGSKAGHSTPQRLITVSKRCNVRCHVARLDPPCRTFALFLKRNVNHRWRTIVLPLGCRHVHNLQCAVNWGILAGTCKQTAGEASFCG